MLQLIQIKKYFNIWLFFFDIRHFILKKKKKPWKRSVECWCAKSPGNLMAVSKDYKKKKLTLSLTPSSEFSSSMIARISRLCLNAQVTWYAVLQVFTLHCIQDPVFSLHNTHTRDHRDCWNYNISSNFSFQYLHFSGMHFL